MAGNVIPFRHSYKVERTKKTYDVYQLVEASKKHFPEFIRIENFRSFSRGTGFDKYLRIKNTTNWQTSTLITGLKKTPYPNVFYGDQKINGCKNLVLFSFTSDRENLTIDYYPYFNPQGNDLEGFIYQYTQTIT